MELLCLHLEAPCLQQFIFFQMLFWSLFGELFFSLRSCKSLSVIFHVSQGIFYDIWREFCGIFSDPQRQGSNIAGNISEYFRKKFVAQNNYFVPKFALQTCHFNFLLADGPSLGNRFLSSAGVGRVVHLPVRMPNPSPTLDKNLAPMGPGILSSIGVEVWRKAPDAFPDSNATLDTCQSAILYLQWSFSACSGMMCV